jgi:hypothetical protein
MDHPPQRKPDNFKSQDIGMIWEQKRGYFVAVCISDIECIRLGDNDPVTPVKHFSNDTVMPSLYNPILRQVDALSLVGKRIVPQNQRSIWRKTFELVRERLEQLVIIFSLPNVGHLIAAKVL